MGIYSKVVRDVLLTPTLTRINEAFVKSGYRVWFVGGAVRDTFLSLIPKDIDLATDATPDQVIALCDEYKFSVRPTGIQHGTVTVCVNAEVYEITTLRVDHDTDGRHATVAFTTEIETDLSRRDLTINAMALDFDGNLIDPFGGLDDLTHRIIRFVGDPNDRMTEDYLRILRWLRFHARFANDSELDLETVNAAVKNRYGLGRISVERIWMEMRQILQYPNALRIIDAIVEMGLDVPMKLTNSNRFNRKALSVAQQHVTNPVVRLAALLSKDTESFEHLARRWKMSREETKTGLTALMVIFNRPTMDACKQLITISNMDKSKICLGLDADGRTIEAEQLRNWVVPIFPVSGKDLIELGMKEGVGISETLRTLKKVWSEGRYIYDKEDLLTSLPFNRGNVNNVQ